MSGGGTGEYVALVCWLLGGALVFVWDWWALRRARERLRGRHRAGPVPSGRAGGGGHR